MSSLSRRMRSFVKGRMMRYLPGMISCAEFEAFVVSYLDGSLGPAEQRKFERHIRFCRECSDYLAAYKRTIELEKAAFETPYSPVIEKAPEDLIKAILASRQ